FDWHEAVGRSRAEHECIELQCDVSGFPDHVQIVVLDAPYQRLRQIIDPPAQALETAVHRCGASRLRAVELPVRTREVVGLPPVDLAAIAPAFIDQSRPDTRRDQLFGTADPGRPGAYDDDARLGHVLSGCCVLIDIPSVSTVEQARSRSPSAV